MNTQVAISLLRGASAAEAFHNGEGKYSLSGKEIQCIDRVQHTTPNLIATATMLVRFLQSFC